ncbi:MAG: hypothetical protein U1E36_01590 [Rickettsiales bacterium]
MNTSSAPEQSKDNITKSLVIALVVVFALAGIGYFAAKSGLSKDQVNASLASFNESLGKYGEQRGYELKLTYDAMDASGGILNKKVTLTNPIFSLKPKNNDAFYRALTLKTAKVDIVTKDAEFNKFNLEFTDPVSVISKDQTAEVSFSQPLKIAVNREEGEEDGEAGYTSDLPPAMTILKADQTKAELGFGSGSKVSGVINLAASNYSHATQISALTLKNADESLKADAVNLTMESGLQDTRFLRHQGVNIDKLTFEGPKAELGSLNIDADLESAIPEKTEQEANAAAGRQVTINKLSIEEANKAYAVNVEGNMDVVKGEIVPQGEVKVSITKPTEALSRMQRASIINPLLQNIALATMPKIDPAWKDGAEQLSFVLKRSAGQPLYVGNMTFEELTAQVLTGFLQQSAPAAGGQSQMSQDNPGTPVTGEESQAPVAGSSTGAAPSDLNVDDISRRLEEQMRQLEEGHVPQAPAEDPADANPDATVEQQQ